MANQNDDLLSFDQWEQPFIERIKGLKKLNTVEKNILEILQSQDRTKIQESVLSRLLNNEYRKYKIDFEVKQAQQKADEQSKALLKRLKPSKQNSRKKREHELITIGALVDVINFPKDRGTVLGALAYVLEQSQRQPEFLNTVKTKGDQILHNREKEKEEAREKARKAKEINQYNSQQNGY